MSLERVASPLSLLSGAVHLAAGFLAAGFLAAGFLAAGFTSAEDGAGFTSDASTDACPSPFDDIKPTLETPIIAPGVRDAGFGPTAPIPIWNSTRRS